jgi:hypothetical protein
VLAAGSRAGGRRGGAEPAAGGGGLRNPSVPGDAITVRGEWRASKDNVSFYFFLFPECVSEEWHFVVI